MKKITSIFAVAALFTLTQFHAPIDSPDQRFVMEAAQDGMLEVQLGKMAGNKGKAAEVKEFGRTMVKEHTKVNDELKALTKKKKMEVPQSLSAERKKTIDSLSAMSGEKFDMLYMNMMIASHEQAIGLFQTQSNKGEDAELKKWADSKVPALKHHLEMAEELFKTSSGSTAKQER